MNILSQFLTLQLQRKQFFNSMLKYIREYKALATMQAA